MHDIEKLKEAGIVSIRDALIEQQKQGWRVARTESGDPSFDPPPNVLIAMSKAQYDKKTHYTPGGGIDSLREACFEKLTTENKIKLDSPSQVLVTAGAMNALYVTFQSILEDGDEVLVPTPTWTETVTNVELARGKPVYYTVNPFLNEAVSVAEIKQKINKNTKAIVINTPHNPTGSIMLSDTAAKLAQLCDEKGLYLVSDEAYEHLLYDTTTTHNSPGRWMTSDRCISIFSCSKSYAMSGLRVGYLSCKGEQTLRKLRKYIRCTANGVNSVAQHGAAEAIKNFDYYYHAKMMSEYSKRRDILYKALCRSQYLKPAVPHGAFYVWCRINGAWEYDKEHESRSWAFTSKLLNKGIGSAPGDCFGPGGEDCIRFAFSCRTEDVEIAAEVLEKM